MELPNYRETKLLVQMQFDPFSLQPVDVEWMEKYYPVPIMNSESRIEPESSSKKSSAQQRRKVREEAAEGQYTEEEWFDLQTHYNNCCLRCGSTDKRIVADHIKPLFRGGSNGIENLQPLCWECNLWKGLKIIDFRPDIETKPPEAT